MKIIFDLERRLMDSAGKISAELLREAPQEDVSSVAEYMRSCEVVVFVPGVRKCEICGEIAGADTCRSDGKWIWPDWAIHYFVKHNLQLPEAFLGIVRGSSYVAPKLTNLFSGDAESNKFEVV